MGKQIVSAQSNLQTNINVFLEETPGQSVKELAIKLKVNRTFLSGYLRALEEDGKLESRKIGPAKVYYVKKK